MNDERRVWAENKETICAQTYIPFDRSHFFCIAPDPDHHYSTIPLPRRHRWRSHHVVVVPYYRRR